MLQPLSQWGAAIPAHRHPTTAAPPPRCSAVIIPDDLERAGRFLPTRAAAAASNSVVHCPATGAPDDTASRRPSRRGARESGRQPGARTPSVPPPRRPAQSRVGRGRGAGPRGRERRLPTHTGGSGGQRIRSIKAVRAVWEVRKGGAAHTHARAGGEDRPAAGVQPPPGRACAAFFRHAHGAVSAARRSPWGAAEGRVGGKAGAPLGPVARARIRRTASLTWDCPRGPGYYSGSITYTPSSGRNAVDPGPCAYRTVPEGCGGVPTSRRCRRPRQSDRPHGCVRPSEEDDTAGCGGGGGGCGAVGRPPLLHPPPLPLRPPRHRHHRERSARRRQPLAVEAPSAAAAAAARPFPTRGQQRRQRRGRRRARAPAAAPPTRMTPVPPPSRRRPPSTAPVLALRHAQPRWRRPRRQPL